MKPPKFLLLFALVFICFLNSFAYKVIIIVDQARTGYSTRSEHDDVVTETVDGVTTTYIVTRITCTGSGSYNCWSNCGSTNPFFRPNYYDHLNTIAISDEVANNVMCLINDNINQNNNSGTIINSNVSFEYTYGLAEDGVSHILTIDINEL